VTKARRRYLVININSEPEIALYKRYGVGIRVIEGRTEPGVLNKHTEYTLINLSGD
jgi:hypothetical protein